VGVVLKGVSVHQRGYYSDVRFEAAVSCLDGGRPTREMRAGP
jgi:hypothetical protein